MILVGLNKNILDLRTSTYRRACEDLEKTRVWLKEHPGHKLYDHMVETEKSQSAERQRLYKLMMRHAVDLPEELLDKKESTNCIVCGERVRGSKVIFPGHYIHAECFHH